MLSNIFVIIVSIYIIACMSSLIVNYKLKLDGFTGILWYQCFSPLKHFSFVLGYTISIIPWWIRDQYALRFYNKKCGICIKKKECIQNGVKGCGCDPFSKACSPFESCRFGHYGPIIFNKTKAIAKLSNFKIESENVGLPQPQSTEIKVPRS
jgi:hypothetical protein